jgi:hypothetical protein
MARYDRYFHGGFSNLSRITGLIRPNGLELWAHVILIDTEST